MPCQASKYDAKKRVYNCLIYNKQCKILIPNGTQCIEEYKECLKNYEERNVKSKSQIIDKINEYYQSSQEKKSELAEYRDMGFIDGLRWVIESQNDEEEE